MEKWEEIFAGKIPKELYQMQLINGEQQGLTIELSSANVCVMIKFGIVQAVRMLDEGIVQRGLYSDSEIEKYKEDGFSNVIYEVHEGEFGKQIKNFLKHVLYVKKVLHTYICMFMKKRREEEGCGFGVVNVTHFFMVQFMYRNIGEIVHWWKLRNYVLYRII